MFQQRPIGASQTYNSFDSPYYAIHRDMAYCGISLVVSTLKSIEDLKTIEKEDLAKLSESLKSLLVELCLNYKKSYKDSLVDSNFLNLNKKVRDEFLISLAEITLRFIFESQREANYGFTDEINLKKYNEAINNATEVQVFIRYKFFEKIIFILKMKTKQLMNKLKYLFSFVHKNKQKTEIKPPEEIRLKVYHEEER